ncbi:transcription elongation factor s-II, putative [Trypanosoma equiperdum]|uniref:Transcription elongation factor, putative n=2 Tax=Trypanozoon TaxID=39700 RepID=Q385S2_TRYB2|nr:transcription elongation factor, putative [Trypanosoma brucei brucei TREU927]EAN79459.1 transcription elongation factor, putative [Trypanosoma brucei brucei TREU927]SCU66415.1 transcription elongation factor s-II, putative [Trypanosoma equiperdum]
MGKDSNDGKIGVKRFREESKTALGAPTSPPVTPNCINNTSVTVRNIEGRQGDTRLTKWKTLLCKALMQGRKEEDEGRVADMALRIVKAIPGGRSESADTFRMLLVHLGDAKNRELRESIIEEKFSVEVLVRMKERDLLNPEERERQEAAFLARSRDTDLTEIRKATSTTSTLFPCPSCKAKNCTWTQKQTRSADEPMTIFCICNICEHKWRRY